MGAAAIPAMKIGGSALGGLAAKFFGKPSKPQQAGMAGTQAAAGQIGAMAPQLMQAGQQPLQQGTAALSQAGGYYNKLLSGDRAMARDAMAPEIATAMDYYRGAGAKASRTLKGPARDEALAELDRDKVGNLALMGSQARQTAAAGAERVGQAQSGIAANLFGQGVNAASNAGWINNYAFNQGSQIRDQERESGKGFGGLIFDLLSGMVGPKKPDIGFDRPTMHPVPFYGRQ